MTKLVSLNDDSIIHILSFLEPVHLISVRKTCKRMHALTALRIVWKNACLHYIIGKGYPFPKYSLDGLSVWELEQYVCHSAELAKKWLSGSWTPRRSWLTSATANISVTDTRLIPGSRGTLLITLSKTIWSVITLWKLESVVSPASSENCSFEKCCEWSPRRAIVSGFTLNLDPLSEAKLAVSSMNNGNHVIDILSLKSQDKNDDWCFQLVLSITTSFRPISLEGDLLAIGDDIKETIVLNWRTQAHAALLHARDDQEILQHDKCIQVVFTPQSVLVVRAHFVYLFPFPVLKAKEDLPLHYFPMTRHSFGWVDSVFVQCVSENINSPATLDKPLPLSILVRTETDDPWASDGFSLEFYTLHVNPHYVPSGPDEDKISCVIQGTPVTPSTHPPQPYIFPPVLTSKAISRRGSLRCTDVLLGKLGTALWIQPKDWSVAGLYWTADNALVGPQNVVCPDRRYESLIATVFPGNLLPIAMEEGILEAQTQVIRWNEEQNCSSITYDEDVGRIVLATGFGSITVLDM